MKTKPDLEKICRYYTQISYTVTLVVTIGKGNDNYKGDMHYFRVKNNMSLYHEIPWNTSTLVIGLSLSN